MKLIDCLSKIDSMKAWDVRFYEEKPLFGPIIRTVTDRMNVLYNEWRGSGPNNPGSDRQVYGLMFANREDGRTFLVDDSEVLTFEELMQAITKLVRNQEA